MEQDDELRIEVVCDLKPFFGELRSETIHKVGKEPFSLGDLGQTIFGGNAETQESDKAFRAEADMRSLATALEAHNIDHGAYPADLHALTTPVAYVRSIPDDPFAEAGQSYRYVAEDGGWTLYSIGPDGVDDEAKTVYDPSDGEEGKGDIVRQAAF